MYSTMIVDDYEVFRRDLRTMPVWGEKSGFIIAEEAANGRDALQKLMKQPVDLLLTDIRMPFIDGLELIQKATEQALCGCIIIMSQFGDFEYARKGLSSGALDYLLKPVKPEELSKALVRAAACIKEKNQTASRIQYLENMLTRSAESFFPDRELDNLLKYIAEGSLHALDAAAHLADSTCSELDLVLINTAQVLNRVLKKLADAVLADFSWLPKFLDLEKLKAGEFSQYGDFSSLKAAFVGKVDILLSTIRQYELDIENDSLVRMACRSLLENIDTDLTISELANRLFITRTYLSQVFREKTGTTLVKYMTDIKIDRAKFLVLAGSKNYEIAEILGYKDDEYFKKLFKKTTGMSLSEYRNTHAE
jgi:two-component system response regulator YesN